MFQSLNPKISRWEEVKSYIGEALRDQHMFEKRTTPWELNQGGNNNCYNLLQEFRINPKDIDRLYYIYNSYGDISVKEENQEEENEEVEEEVEEEEEKKEDEEEKNENDNDDHHDYDRNPPIDEGIFEMLARVWYEDRPLYVELKASCNFSGCYCGDGIVFVSRDPNIFMKLVLDSNRHPVDEIYQSLAQDGIFFQREEMTRDQSEKFLERNPPSLDYFCHGVVYQHLDRLETECETTLPKHVREGLRDFVQLQEARAEREKPVEL